MRLPGMLAAALAIALLLSSCTTGAGTIKSGGIASIIGQDASVYLGKI